VAFFILAPWLYIQTYKDISKWQWIGGQGKMKAMDEFLSEVSSKILSHLEPSGLSLKEILKAVEREVIRKELEAYPEHHGRVAAIARVFGCKRTTLSMKMLDYGLRVKGEKAGDPHVHA